MTLVIVIPRSLVQKRLRYDADDIVCRRPRKGHVERLLLPGSEHSDKCLSDVEDSRTGLQTV
jgi:hypothetical protein